MVFLGCRNWCYFKLGHLTWRQIIPFTFYLKKDEALNILEKKLVLLKK